jgi:hypothetical protein
VSAAGPPAELEVKARLLLLFHQPRDWAANTAAGLVLILLLFEPTRDLWPVL